MTRLSAVSSRLAVLAACSICALPAVSRAADGTITFLGAIVEPPYEVRVTAAAPSSTYATSISKPEAEISFSSSGNLSASVHADGLGPLPVAVRCTGATPMPAGGCHLGPRGGALSIAAMPTATAGVARGAILTVAYD